METTPVDSHIPALSYVMSTGSSRYDVARDPVATGDDPGSTWGRCRRVVTSRATANNRGDTDAAADAPSADETGPQPGSGVGIVTGLPDFIGPQPEQLLSRGDRVLRGRLHIIIVPDPTPHGGRGPQFSL